MIQKNVKALLFDFDGTIVNSFEASVEGMQKTFDRFLLPLPKSETIKSLSGIPLEKIFPIMGGDSYPKDRHQEIIDYYRSIYPAICDEKTIIYEGMERLIKRAHQQGLRLAIVTSKKSSMTMRTLKKNSLDGYFDIIIGSDDVENYKPHPEPALRALAFLGIPPSESVVIGDSIYDIQMGQAAGCQTCAVTWGSHDGSEFISLKPGKIVHNVSELFDWICEECSFLNGQPKTEI